MSHPYIPPLRPHLSHTMSTDSYLGHWPFTALKNCCGRQWIGTTLCQLATSGPSCPHPCLLLFPPIISNVCYLSRPHEKRSKALSVNNGTQEQENRKWNQDHTDALWLVETRLWRPYAVITMLVAFQMGCCSTKDVTLTTFKENLFQSNRVAFFSRYSQSTWRN